LINPIVVANDGAKVNAYPVLPAKGSRNARNRRAVRIQAVKTKLRLSKRATQHASQPVVSSAAISSAEKEQRFAMRLMPNRKMDNQIHGAAHERKLAK
jgi:hypothetical protein